jgi:hypothetical protein
MRLYSVTSQVSQAPTPRKAGDSPSTAARSANVVSPLA